VDLTAEQVAGLETHLDACQECGHLAQAWHAVEADLRAAPQITPQEGFTARWQARLALEGRRQHRRQGILLGLGSLGLAVAIIGGLTYAAWPLLQSPGLLLWAYLYQVIRWFSLLSAAQGFLGSFLQAIDLVIHPLVLVFGAGSLTLLCVLWLVSLRTLINPRSVSK
jgi:hypothetical protein